MLARKNQELLQIWQIKEIKHSQNLHADKSQSTQNVAFVLLSVTLIIAMFFFFQFAIVLRLFWFCALKTKIPQF